MASPEPTIVLVDTTASLDLCISDISPITGTQPAKLAIDLEGVELCRNGNVSIVQIFADTSNVIWLVDVTTLGRAAFDHQGPFGQSLRGAFQNPSTKKLLFDVRNDADALWNIYQIELANVYDLQLLEVASRRSRNLPSKIVIGLSQCIESYVGPPNAWKEVKEAGINLFSPAKGGSYTIFETRPLDSRIIAYCAQDVALSFQLEAAIKRTMIGRKNWKRWDERVTFGSANRVAESKSPNYSRGGKKRVFAPKF